MIRLSSLKPNPDNPRIIKDDKFKKLCENIKSLPKMMILRPIVIDQNNIVQGGNMRLRALKELGYKEIPNEWVKKATDYSDAELKQFSILDNIGFGQWDWGILANEWEQSELIEWGFDPWNFGEINYATEPDTVIKNIKEIEKIRAQRKNGKDSIIEKTDTEKYLVIVFNSREEKQVLLEELNLPKDERYIPSGGVQIIPSGAWISKFKSSAQNKSGATG